MSWHLALWRYAQVARLSLLAAACETGATEVDLSNLERARYLDFRQWVVDELWRLRHAPASPRIACRDCGASPGAGAALYRLPGPDRVLVCEAHLRMSLRGRERLRMLDKR